tara:strand:+ start:547 stop:879 length:333 start_codon:yes stop_codon:yes gene_type:complete
MAEEESIPSWIKLKSADVESLITELAKKDLTPAQLGLELRDKHSIPKAKLITKKRITHTLRSTNVQFKSSEDSIQKKLEKLQTHLNNNKQDYRANRALTKKIWDLKKTGK